MCLAGAAANKKGGLCPFFVCRSRLGGYPVLCDDYAFGSRIRSQHRVTFSTGSAYRIDGQNVCGSSFTTSTLNALWLRFVLGLGPLGETLGETLGESLGESPVVVNWVCGGVDILVLYSL